MAEYREYISVLRECAKEHENDKLFTGQIDTTALCNDTAKLLENDVIERTEYEFLKKENKELAIKYDNAMNMVINEQENVIRLRSKIDKAIEEINKLYDDFANCFCEYEQGKNKAIDEVLEILKKI